VTSSMDSNQAPFSINMSRMSSSSYAHSRTYSNSSPLITVANNYGMYQQSQPAVKNVHTGLSLKLAVPDMLVQQQGDTPVIDSPMLGTPGILDQVCSV
jgi:hypothetical protein